MAKTQIEECNDNDDCNTTMLLDDMIQKLVKLRETAPKKGKTPVGVISDEEAFSVVDIFPDATDGEHAIEIHIERF